MIFFIARFIVKVKKNFTSLLKTIPYEFYK